MCVTLLVSEAIGSSKLAFWLTSKTAQKHIRDMKKGDLAFFYHSNCKVPGIAGIMEIVKEHSPDG